MGSSESKALTYSAPIKISTAIVNGLDWIVAYDNLHFLGISRNSKIASDLSRILGGRATRDEWQLSRPNALQISPKKEIRYIVELQLSWTKILNVFIGNGWKPSHGSKLVEEPKRTQKAHPNTKNADAIFFKKTSEALPLSLCCIGAYDKSDLQLLFADARDANELLPIIKEVCESLKLLKSNSTNVNTTVDPWRAITLGLQYNPFDEVQPASRSIPTVDLIWKIVHACTYQTTWQFYFSANVKGHIDYIWLARLADQVLETPSDLQKDAVAPPSYSTGLSMIPAWDGSVKPLKVRFVDKSKLDIYRLDDSLFGSIRGVIEDCSLTIKEERTIGSTHGSESRIGSRSFEMEEKVFHYCKPQQKGGLVSLRAQGVTLVLSLFKIVLAAGYELVMEYIARRSFDEKSTLIFKPTSKTRNVKIIGLAMETLSTLLLIGQYDLPTCKAIHKELDALGFLRSSTNRHYPTKGRKSEPAWSVYNFEMSKNPWKEKHQALSASMMLNILIRLESMGWQFLTKVNHRRRVNIDEDGGKFGSGLDTWILVKDL